ncbi:sulfur reduction protein DsrE [Archaeoglobales archaeon]|nr:MAG: sulfur reduction protein DsrE [Archaeoglobales archaeon]
MGKKALIILNSGPEDPCRTTAAFLTAKALAEKGEDVAIWLYNQAVYLAVDGTQSEIQAPGLPPFEDLFLFLTQTKKTPVYVGISCAVGRGLVDPQGNPKIKFCCGELANPTKLAELTEEADHILTF